MNSRAVSFFGRGTVFALLVAGALAIATAAPMAHQSIQNPLRVGMVALEGGNVEVTVTNAGMKTLRIPKWQLPSEAARSDLFRIALDGREIRFEGALVKRGVPMADDFAILRPGHSHRSVVALGELYDLSQPGVYTVTYLATLQYASLSGRLHLRQRNGLPMEARGAPIQVKLTGLRAPTPAAPPTTLSTALPAALPGGGRLRPVQSAVPVLSDVVGLSYIGCNATQQSEIGLAMLTARSYSERAKGYLNLGGAGPRYTTWFGGYTSSRYATAQQHFAAIDAALDQTGGQIAINCGCTQNYYAYVFKNQHYQIYVCNKFWAAPRTGTDSRAGTLIHEISHFTVVTDTDDHAYGHTDAKALAINNPTLALDNADTHEYFAENTPAQN